MICLIRNGIAWVLVFLLDQDVPPVGWQQRGVLLSVFKYDVSPQISHFLRRLSRVKCVAFYTRCVRKPTGWKHDPPGRG